jgi:hypothetical protein
VSEGRAAKLSAVGEPNRTTLLRPATPPAGEPETTFRNQSEPNEINKSIHRRSNI